MSKMSIALSSVVVIDRDLGRVHKIAILRPFENAM